MFTLKIAPEFQNDSPVSKPQANRIFLPPPAPPGRKRFSARNMGAGAMLASVVALASLTMGSQFASRQAPSAPAPLQGPLITAYRPVGNPPPGASGMIAAMPDNSTPQNSVDAKPTGSIAPAQPLQRAPHAVLPRRVDAHPAKPVVRKRVVEKRNP